MPKEDLVEDDTAKMSDHLKAVNDAVEALQEGFSLWDADMNFMLCNDRYMEIVFAPGTERIAPGANAVDVVPLFFEGDRLEVPEGVPTELLVQDVISWITSYGPSREFFFKDGRVMRAKPQRTRLGGFLITVLDVTEERNAEAKAREMLSSAIESLEEGLALWDSDLRFVMCNRRYVELALPYRTKPFPSGTTIADSVRQFFHSGQTILPDHFSEEELVAGAEDWVRNFGPPVEHLFRDGRVVVLSVKPTELGGFLITAVDVTEERNSEQKARDMLFDAFQTLDEGMVLCDGEMRFIFGNDAWKRMMFEGTGAKPPEPGDSAIDNMIAQMKSGFFDIPDEFTPQSYANWILSELARPGNTVPFSSADGRHFIGSSHQTSYGGALLSIRDITEVRRYEQELAQQREMAHQNEKLSALGELLAGVAHELNNPLSVVFGYSQMLQGKVDDPVLAERVDLICQSAERAAKIVKTFLAMARQRPKKVETCAINEIVATALEVSSYSLKANGTEVLTHFDETDPHIEGDFDQLAQVFSNLLINAGQAVEPLREDGQIVVKSAFDAQAGEAVVEIRDNGPGIPKDIQARIFEPFFTTKEVGQGTGVGLAFSHRIIASHDGALGLRSAPGKGTRFFVRLKANEHGTAAPSAPTTAHRAPKAQHVLVLDDEDGVAQLVSDLLLDAGMQVTKMTEPRAALRLIATQHFDAVISDFKMPDMNGETFFEAVKAITPKLADRIGFMTGDALSENVRAFLSQSGCPYIEKPIVTGELMTLLAEISETGGRVE